MDQFSNHIFTEQKYKSYLSRLIQSENIKGLMEEYINIQFISTQTALRRTVIDNSESFSYAMVLAGKVVEAGYKPSEYSEEVAKKVFKNT